MQQQDVSFSATPFYIGCAVDFAEPASRSGTLNEQNFVFGIPQIDKRFAEFFGEYNEPRQGDEYSTTAVL